MLHQIVYIILSCYPYQIYCGIRHLYASSSYDVCCYLMWRRDRIPSPYPCESYEATEREPSARVYNWATLFLGDINTGTWPSRLGESQEFGQ
jgi:hypothetical protein